MKIINQSHTIEHITPNILYQIEIASRNCWKSEGKLGCTEGVEHNCPGLIPNDYDNHCMNSDCYAHSSHKMVKMLIKRGHEAILEFGDIRVRMITNRGVTHELVRHRIGMSYAQESTRYVRYDGEMEFIRPVWCSDKLLGDFPEYDHIKDINSFTPENEIDWLELCLEAEYTYSRLLQNGWRPEQAREVLPNSLKTEIVVKGNVRSWRHMFQLRTSKKSHPQIRSLMTNLLIDLKTKIPVVFDDIGGE